jgi:tetratricopeptide (TPR) repeat protein
MIIPCTNMDPDHRRCFRHPVDDFVAEEVVDETPDELDLAVVRDEPSWSSPDVGSVSEEEAMEAKAAAAEAAANGDHEAAVAAYSKALGAMPSALTYAKRAEAHLRLGRPSAAVADCDKALELNPDSAKAYKVCGKALVKTGAFRMAFERLCTGNKIDEDEDSAALQKQLKAKVDKIKKINDARGKRAKVAFEGLGLDEVWASLEPDVLTQTGANGLEALRQWADKDRVGLKARLGELKVNEEQAESVFGAIASVGAVDVS